MKIHLSHITFTLRLGLAFAYIFIAILCFYSPSDLVPYTRPVITSDHLRLSFSVIGVLSLGLAGWIISAKRAYTSSVISFIIFLAILILGIEKSPVIFATLEVLCLNLALIFAYRLGKTVIPEVVAPEVVKPELSQENKPSTVKPIDADVVDDGPADTIL